MIFTILSLVPLVDISRKKEATKSPVTQLIEQFFFSHWFREGWNRSCSLPFTHLKHIFSWASLTDYTTIHPIPLADKALLWDLFCHPLYFFLIFIATYWNLFHLDEWFLFHHEINVCLYHKRDKNREIRPWNKWCITMGN